MKDIQCPYCDYEQAIDHVDGYGYKEDETYQQQCESCEKYFAYTTSIRFYYNVSKADCLNGSEHKFKPTTTIPREFTKMYCADCGEERQPTFEEMTEILKRP